MTAHMRVTIDRVALPASADDADATDFRDFVDVGNACSLDLWGSDDFVYDAADQLAWFRPSEFSMRMLYLARLDGLAVGRLLIRLPLDEDATGAELEVLVLPTARRHGIGSALLAQGESVVADGGRVDISVFTEHLLDGIRPDAAVVEAADGDVGLPEDDPFVRFAVSHGYRLGQVEVVSELALPAASARIEDLRADAVAHAADYELCSWFPHCPDDLVDSYAAAIERMTTDVPHEGIAVDTEKWDAARVRAIEQRGIDRGKPWLTTAAISRADGRLAGYTELEIADASPVVEQGDTLVTPEHRGHRLGMLMKLHNLDRLADVAPHVRRVITWNAEENGPMRAINEAIGFRTNALTGNWQKTLG
ncbi:GNAT family N-acetyltransferase [Planctomonas sp. JC2975]|uniref:GNAT family N-acetyltransferase n=1 Tax=Planctomonas sp. JC2975 TaxID=2729626 RepID=UPI001472E0B9|nr:GNAT family N-acetyltransferase [Planctomonas sp. JC2975]NNC10982.1 GNAT family N-acetyltransferase [Planctomonas sp. JC2975]